MSSITSRKQAASHLNITLEQLEDVFSVIEDASDDAEECSDAMYLPMLGHAVALWQENTKTKIDTFAASIVWVELTAYEQKREKLIKDTNQKKRN